jgi:hypothetical protein
MHMPLDVLLQVVLVLRQKAGVQQLRVLKLLVLRAVVAVLLDHHAALLAR